MVTGKIDLDLLRTVLSQLKIEIDEAHVFVKELCGDLETVSSNPFLTALYISIDRHDGPRLHSLFRIDSIVSTLKMIQSYPEPYYWFEGTKRVGHIVESSMFLKKLVNKMQDYLSSICGSI